jgi:DNA-binding PadR family transcriptional regulator
MRPSPAALAVLSLLHVGPLHPYGMQRLLKLWGKDAVVNVGQRANLYKTIKRLHEVGLVAVRQTERDQQYPERTVYELTDAGRQAANLWLAQMVATPRREFNEFPAAMSFVMLLDPATTRNALQQRVDHLEPQLAKITADLTAYARTLPRVTLLDTDYQRAILTAELKWLRRVIKDLDSGDLSWTEELAELARSFLSE